MKTCFKWQGNKSKQLKHLVKEVPNTFNTYIEPFVGSGALLLNLQPSKWIINDLNKYNYGIWKLIQKNPSKIKRKFLEFKKIFPSMSLREKLLYCRRKDRKSVV